LSVLLMASSAAIAQPGRDNGSRGNEKGEDGGRSPTPVPIGAFDVDSAQRSAHGEFVSFTYNETGIHGYTVDGVTILDIVIDGRLRNLEEVKANGPQLKLKATGFSLLVHDNPGAVSRLHTDVPVRFSFAPDARVATSREGTQVAFTLGELSGKVKGDSLTVNGNTVTGRGDVLFLLDSLRGSFDTHRPDISRAIGKGHVGVEASFNSLDGDVEEDVVSYGNVTLTRLKAERGNLTLLIDGHGLDGRVLVLNVDGRLVGADKKEDLVILFDNETIGEASSLEDVLDPDDDGLKAEYYIVFDVKAEAFQLLVSVPHYSVHTLSLTTIISLPPPSVILGIVAGVALLAPGAYVLFRRK
jgi:hypothetical protein